MIINGKVATDQQMSIILDGEIDAQLKELDSLAAEVVEVERLIDEKFKQVESFRNRAARS